ncbi:hypothetical protein GCM10011487_40200 [Steroidobacter agaridevorans]|uniref:Uncharacterized protein n=2 Tax=Steroidobacter agaridevorans TaxID=2695856 RepID=A0A829YFL6_9GAMM|nr:hypothetical protein [Steroidobacter agaridevorans]GFE82020.1 hypothetical protein GCM10011487_40200 [Steroidobacter agaridevorans]GFE85591.1 hypothetical protein GCM10011488_05450 [Steroidobacter agaridevorans]
MRGGLPLSSEFMNALATVEAQLPVLDWRVGGIAVWPLVRVRWMFAEFTAAKQRAEVGPTPSVSAVSRLRAMASGAMRGFTDSILHARDRDRGPVRRDLVFLSDGLSFARIGPHWVERFCDPLIADASANGLSSALWTPLHTYRRPLHTPSRSVQAGVDRATVRAMLRRAPLPAVLPMREEACEVLSRAGFGASSLALAKILSDAARLRAVADFYRAKLERTRPKLAMLVSYYSLEGFAFVLACRESGVPVVDLQHGVQGSMHPAYAAWPRPKDRTHPLLPDYFWVWSDWEREVISQWSVDTTHSAVVGGNPWMNVWRDSTAWPGSAAALTAGRELKARSGHRPVVLVTLQFGFAPADQIDPLARLIEHAADRFAFWVRLHPVMLAEREAVRSRLGNPERFLLDEPTDLPLQALLPSIDLHLTHSSSTVIEAAQFGVRSVLTTQWGAELFEPSIEQGWAHLETGDEIQLAATLERVLALGRGGDLAESAQRSALVELIEQATDRRTRERT